MAACSSVVFSSTTESGARLGGLLAADAAPRSEQEHSSLAIACEIKRFERLTCTSLLPTETSTASQDNGSLRGENHLAGHLVDGLNGTGNVRRFALRKRSELVQSRSSSSHNLITHLVEHLKKLGSVDKRSGCGNRAVDLEVLLSVK